MYCANTAFFETVFEKKIKYYEIKEARAKK
jgi:hypothetical protein